MQVMYDDEMQYDKQVSILSNKEYLSMLEQPHHSTTAQ